MSIVLRSVVDHPETGPAELISGSPQRRLRRVRGLVVPADRSAVADAIAQVDASRKSYRDALVVLFARDVDLDWHLDVLLRRLVDLQAAALVVSQRRDASVEPLRRLARRFGIGLVLAEDPWAVATVSEAALTSTRSRDDLRVLDVLRLGAQGTQGEQTLLDLIAGLSDLLRREVVLLDASGAVISGDIGLPRIDLPAIPAVATRAAPVRVPVLDEHDPGQQRPPMRRILLAAPLPAVTGGLWMGVETDAEIAADLEHLAPIVEAAAIVCGQAHASARIDAERDANQRRAVIDALRVSEEGGLRPELRRRIADLGWNLDGALTAVRIRASGSGIDEFLLTQLVRAELEASGLAPVLVEQDDGWVAWVEAGPETARQLRRANQELRRAVPTSMGISRSRAGAEGLIRSLREAEDTAKVAATRPNAGYTAAADRLGFDQLLLAWTSADSFAHTVGDVMGRLDGTNPELRPTLRAYLDAESSLTETAAVLGVHRNTVAARIQRIEELLDISLREPDTRLALHLMTRAET